MMKQERERERERKLSKREREREREGKLVNKKIIRKEIICIKS